MDGLRKLAFVLASSKHGTMIVNRFDVHMINAQAGYGVGHQILETAAFDPLEVKLAIELLLLRRRHYGDGVVAFDCGANIGVHTVEWAVAMTGWGSVLAVEAQERIYYALAGNIAINNCFNAIALNAAVSSQAGAMKIPSPNYTAPASFGSLELRQRANNEFIGQAIKFLQSTDSTAPQRIPQPAKPVAQRMADDVSYRRERAYWDEQDRLFANGREPTKAEIDEVRRKYPEQSHSGSGPAPDFGIELPPSSERQA